MKNKISLKNLEIIGAIIGIMGGVMLHFVYEWLGRSNIVATFAAVNESVWEHTKLLFIPIVIFMIVEWFWVEDKQRLLFAKMAEIVVTSLFIVTFFYTYTGALGVESLIVDIISFIVAVILGKILSYKMLTSGYKPKLPTWFYALGLVSLFAFYLMVTFNPPRVPMFKDSETGTYGIEK